MGLFGFVVIVVLLVFGKFVFWPYLKMNFSAGKTMFKKDADEVYDYLREKAVNGEVPQSVQINAYNYMIEKGFSDHEATNFVLATAMQVSQEAQKSRRKIYRAKERINDLSIVEHWVMTHTDPVTAAEVGYDIEHEKDLQRIEIERQEKRLKI